MWHPFSRSLFSKNFISSTVSFVGLCFSLPLYSQVESPLKAPVSTAYPGMIETFEKIIKVDAERFQKKLNALVKAGKFLSSTKDVKDLDLDVDFLNSLILHSDPGYLKVAGSSRCRLYDTLITDLLRTAEGKVSNVIVSYSNQKGDKESAVMPRKDFLNVVVNSECPETPKFIAEFQVKKLDEVIKKTNFDTPAGELQCQSTLKSWVSNPRTPYFCQLHEYMKEVEQSEGDPKTLEERGKLAKIISSKFDPMQKNFLRNLCTNLDNEKIFCEEFQNVSFWNRIAEGRANKIYAEGICQGTPLKACLARVKKEPDLCLFPSGNSKGLSPQLECDQLSLALNHSSLRADYHDCASSSDEQGVTNFSRILSHFSNKPIQTYQGPCSAISSGQVFNFEKANDLDNTWELEACYNDKILERDVCYKTFFGAYGSLDESYNEVVAKILQRTRGADQRLKCQMVSDKKFSPYLLDYKSGCHIVYEENRCFISSCPHRIVYNDRTIDFIEVRNRVRLDYFATSLQNERFSLQYVLNLDSKIKAKSLSSLSAMRLYFKKSAKGIIHGVGCAEELLPSFFKPGSMNQCTALPFTIDGLIPHNEGAFVFRSAADSLQAPRIISWSRLYSAVKEYERHHPLSLWTIYGLE
jgi:hypothetical protein